MKIFAIMLAALLIFAGCGTGKIDTEKPVFETENIKSITVFAVPECPEGIVVPEEYMEEVTEWIGTFRLDKKAGNIPEPGSNVLSLKIEYNDGTVVESGVNTITVNKVTYEMKFERTPECINILFE